MTEPEQAGGILRWTAGVFVHHALAVGVQPDQLAAEAARTLEQLGITGDRQPQAWAHEVCLEACRKSGMRHHTRDVGHHVFGHDRAAVGERKVREE